MHLCQAVIVFSRDHLNNAVEYLTPAAMLVKCQPTEEMPGGDF
jgi:hypothetical protein